MKQLTVRELRRLLFTVSNQEALVGFADTQKGMLPLVAINVSDDGDLVTLGFLNVPDRSNIDEEE